MQAKYSRAVRAVAAAACLAAAVGVAGCAAAPARVAPPIQIGTSYVPVPATAGTTVAYVVIRNNGPADRLMSARTSAGGRVARPGPARRHDHAYGRLDRHPGALHGRDGSRRLPHADHRRGTDPRRQGHHPD